MLLSAVLLVSLAFAGLPCKHKYKGATYSCCLVPPTSACGAKCIVAKCKAQGTMFTLTGAYANPKGKGSLYYNCCKRTAGTTPPAPKGMTKVMVTGNACWKKTYGRGLGKAIHTCRAGEVQSGLLCYPRCKKGYAGAGPVCWENCKAGFRDDGAFCAKPAAYGRGVGYPLWDKKRCEAGHGWSTETTDSESSSTAARRLLGAPRKIGPKRRECEQNGLLYYPKCKPGFHNVACCICSPNCPAGQTDIGVSCAKRSYGRGWGKPLTCNFKKEEMNGLLCYPKCKGGFEGDGPVCWAKCPRGWHQCGCCMCTRTKAKCTSKILKIVGGAVTSAGALAAAGIAGAAGVAASIGLGIITKGPGAAAGLVAIPVVAGATTVAVGSGVKTVGELVMPKCPVNAAMDTANLADFISLSENELSSSNADNDDLNAESDATDADDSGDINDEDDGIDILGV